MNVSHDNDVIIQSCTCSADSALEVRDPSAIMATTLFCRTLQCLEASEPNPFRTSVTLLLNAVQMGTLT